MSKRETSLKTTFSPKKKNVRFTYGLEEYNELRLLHNLIKYIKQVSKKELKGRFYDEKHMLIYWPHVDDVFGSYQRFQEWAKTTWIPEDDFLYLLRSVFPDAWLHNITWEIQLESYTRPTQPVALPPATKHTLDDLRNRLPDLLVKLNAPDLQEQFTALGLDKIPLTNETLLKVARYYFDESEIRKRTYKRIKALLGPLVIDDPDIKRNIFMSYLQTHMQERALTTEERRALHKPLMENAFLKDSLVFRHVRGGDNAILRTRPWLLPDLRVVEPQLSHVPHIVQLLWRAWNLAYTSPKKAYDSGIEFVHNGYICINWRQFKASSCWPKFTAIPSNRKTVKHFQGVDQFSADEIMQKIETLTFFRPFRRGLIKRDDTSFNPRIVSPYHRKYNKGGNAFMLFCQETEAFEYTEKRCDPCTVIDPIIISDNIKYFTGSYYEVKQVRQQRNAALTPYRDLSSLTHKKNTARYYRFTFKPFNYLDPSERQAFSLGPDYEEPIYAIRRKDGLCFTRPMALATLKPIVPAEVETWHRAIETMRLEDHFYETKGKMLATQPSRSRFYQRMNDRMKEEFVANHYEKEWEKLSLRQRKKMTSRYAAHAASTKTGFGTQRQHYDDLCARLKREGFILKDVFKTTNILLPDAAEPIKLQFLTPRAVELIHKIANGSFQRIVYTDPVDIALYSMPEMGSAPYVLAWTRFCIELYKANNVLLTKDQAVTFDDDKKRKQLRNVWLREHYQKAIPDGLCQNIPVTPTAKEDEKEWSDMSTVERLRSLSKPADKAQWSPYEDFVLCMRYRYWRTGSKQNFSADEWASLLETLVNRTKMMCVTRARTLNTTFKKCLRQASFVKVWVGRIMDNEEAALRAVFLFGYVKYIKRENEPVSCNHPGIQNIMKFSHRELAKLGLPDTYSNYKFFKALATYTPSSV